MTTKTKLTDTQTVILYNAINKHKDIVPTMEKCRVKCDARAFAAAINGLIKKGLLAADGPATSADYAKEGRKLRVTEDGKFAFSDASDDEENETLAELETEESDEQEEGDEEGEGHSAVKGKYKRIYADRKAEGGTGVGCNDEMDKWFVATFKTAIKEAGKAKRKCLDMPALLAFAKENGFTHIKDATIERAATIYNPGMVSMNIRNMSRSKVRSSGNLTHKGKVVFKGMKQAEEKKAA